MSAGEIQGGASSPGNGGPSVMPRPHAAIDTAVFGNSIMLHDRRSDVTHELNASASAVWLRADGRRNLDQISADLARTFDAPLIDVQSGVRQAVDQFNLLGVLDGSADPGAAPAMELKPVADSLDGQAVMARPPDP